jgi:hypothetical protein
MHSVQNSQLSCCLEVLATSSKFAFEWPVGVGSVVVDEGVAMSDVSSKILLVEELHVALLAAESLDLLVNSFDVVLAVACKRKDFTTYWALLLVWLVILHRRL